eukprot:TRINITY_DN3727_c0_g1_i6.p1 TRINITY_DN3727_c0_g1~~TRINITY_DN3727_c0_g1_i6.p1  ORF type:complete len:220 (-),score=67.43 TRINITY_DN3727_c0_g1_i6:26-685(-)
MIRRPPRSTQGVSSAASDVYKRQVSTQSTWEINMEDTRRKVNNYIDSMRQGEEPIPFSFEEARGIREALGILNFSGAELLDPKELLTFMEENHFAAEFPVIYSLIWEIRNDKPMQLEMMVELLNEKMTERQVLTKVFDALDRDHNVCLSKQPQGVIAVSYTHLRAHETSLHLVCRLLLEKKKKKDIKIHWQQKTHKANQNPRTQQHNTYHTPCSKMQKK